MSPTSIVPAILCGGSGSRLWPLSRPDRPKQLLRLDGTETLLEQAIRRCVPLGPPLLVGSEEHVYPMTEAIRSQGQPIRIIAEPVGRNTAAAAAAVALEVLDLCSQSLVLLVPADHRVADALAFQEAVKRGVAPARAGRIVLFGIEPDGPSTRYGYIRPAYFAPEGGPVAAFIEKPPLELATRLVADGCLWNAGMFLFEPVTLLSAFEQHAPAILHAVQQARAEGSRVQGVHRLGGSWASVPSEPLDRAVMEKTASATVVPVRMGWTDLGTYDALYGVAKGADGNAVVGDVVIEASAGNYLHADGVLLAVQDIHDLVVVATPDATLVAPRSSAGDLKRIVARLGTRREAREHRSSERPWGDYRVLDTGPGFQVKRLTIAPGQSLSLQRHRRRDEHWIVAEGSGEVTVADRTWTVSSNDHLLIEAGSAHRIKNSNQLPLVLIEVQIGSYLREDDIERIEDRYGRR